MERITLISLVRVRDGSARSIIDYCMNLGLLSRRYVCPKCGKDMYLRPRSDINDQFEWVCRSSDHRVKRSIRSGTWFSKSRLPLGDILLLCCFLVHRIEHKVIMSELCLSSSTVCDWSSYVREVFVDACLRMNEPIGGVGKIVEIDESKFGKRKYQRGKHVDGKWVFGGIERDSNRMFFKVVEKRDKITLLNILKTFVLPGTTIHSDCWKSYDCLEDEGFKHFRVNHSVSFKDPETGVHTNAIEGTWSAIKRKLSSRTVTDQFDFYLAEYVWRRVHSDSDDLVRAFFKAVAVLYAPPDRDQPREVDVDDEEAGPSTL